MNVSRQRFLRASIHVAVLMAIAYLLFGFIRPTVATVSIDDQTYKITGPHTHENLSVYLIHAREQDPTTYITLEEGLRTGAVKVTEKDEKQVNELVIENVGDVPLFLQEGDRVSGGEQDRIIYASHVVPPHSGKKPLQAFCVEAGRWAPKENKDARRFEATLNPVLAPLAIRKAAKVQNSQGQVWTAVAGQKDSATAQGLSANTNSSLNETLDSPKVKQLSDEFVAALKDVLANNPDAIGIAVAINGQVAEVNLYPNHDLLTKQYPRLLGSYALDAVLQKKDVADQKTLSANEVCSYIWKNDQESKNQELSSALAMTRRGGRGSDAYPMNGALGNELDTNFDLQRVQEVTVPGQVDGQQQVGILMGTQRTTQQLGVQRQVQTRAWPIQSHGGYTRSEALDRENHLMVIQNGSSYKCTTQNGGKTVHKQFMAREQPTNANIQRGQGRVVPQGQQIEQPSPNNRPVRGSDQP